MKRLAILALGLGACAQSPAPVPLDPGRIAEPAPVLMVTPEPQILIPGEACEADPHCRAETYYGPHRAQCGGYRDTALGLQSYVSVLHSRRTAQSVPAGRGR